ncbi:MAG TPA: sigma 54-interacting transcriptional regulator [Candidatus Dormibacteraeota bacterium]|nr:sigma 54-interacting transcriptional regulator [Candidatus Dormibacteraeota bacterium]
MDPIASCATQQPVISGFISGSGSAMRTLNTIAAEIALTHIPVLITGECGTGKDAYARLVHRLSQEKEATLHKISCAALDSENLLNRLYEQTRERRPEDARGTIYLDCVQDLDLHCQRALLSYLPDDEGAGRSRGSRARVISSTNGSLELEVEAGRFRRELYFRINGACLRLPPLRERKDDIPILLEYFLNKHASGRNKTAPSLGSSTLEMLLAYSWPGNIRELENLALKMVAFGDVHVALDDLQSRRSVNQSPRQNMGVPTLKMAARAASKQAERELILQALERTRWNRKRAAQELQISYKSFLCKLKSIEIPHGGQEN